MSYIIVGLGNPGEEYVKTRHNTGRIMLEALAKKINADDFVEKSGIKALVSKGEVAGKTVTLVEPNNFMNRSGASLTTLVKKPEQVIVIYDDLDLGLGSVKISFNKSSGGHNGLDSVIKAIKSEAFPRIRIGISPMTPSGKVKRPLADKRDGHILGEFKKTEMEVLKKVSKKVIEAVELIVSGQLARAMSEIK